MAQYRLSSATYLYLEGAVPGKDSPTYIEEGTLVGDGTAFPFQGQPNMAMVPLDEAAQAAHDEMMGGYAGGPPTVKGTSAPPEGGATPFDPASGKTDSGSDADKAAADKKAKDDEAAAKKAADDKVKADAAKNSSKS